MEVSLYIRGLFWMNFYIPENILVTRRFKVPITPAVETLVTFEGTGTFNLTFPYDLTFHKIGNDENWDCWECMEYAGIQELNRKDKYGKT